MPTALPQDPNELGLPMPLSALVEPNAISAYNVCLGFERHTNERGTENDLIKARILGYMILYSPSIAARHELVKVIHTCSNDYGSLWALGAHFLDYHIRPFKRIKRRTLKGSSHSSRPSFDKTREELLAEIKEAPKHYFEAKNQALIRDNFRGVVTGTNDLRVNSVPYMNMTRASLFAAGGGVHTECAHIAPDSTYFKVTVDSPRDYSASVLAVLKGFGYNVDNLNGTKVHSLFNVITMEKNVHDLFDRLELWFEKTATLNCYNVRASVAFVTPDQVMFTTVDPDKLPLPSPELLTLHAACAKVAHLSGAGEYVDRIIEDTEQIDVLAYDGTSSDILHHALITLSSRVITA